MTNINHSLQIGVVINIFSFVICSAMFIYFVVLAFSFMFLSNAGCLDLLQNAYFDHINAMIWLYNNRTTDPVELYYYDWVRFDYGTGVFATTLVCLIGWVSSFLTYCLYIRTSCN